MLKRSLLELRYRVWARQLPKVVTVTDFNPRGVRFEASGVVEMHRIVNHGWEPDYLTNMLAALESDDILWDIGANIGLVALHAECQTVAFEPDPGFCRRLQRNLELNPSARLDVLPVAIGDRNQQVTLFSDGAEGISPSLVLGDQRDAVAVQARTIDSLIEEGTLPTPTVLKLDIEGAEILALRGAEHLLHGEAAPRALFLEVHDTFLPRFDSSAEEVLGIVRRAGYETVPYEAKRNDQQHLILERG